jgi:hypothetical protein
MPSDTTTDLIRVVYISAASKLMSQAELDELLSTSRTNNTAVNVSGLLLYHDGSFFQVLEGAEQAVQSVLDRIRRDRRHSSLITLDKSAVGSRGFSSWSMAYVPFAGLSAMQQEGFRDLTQHAADGAAAFTGDARLQIQIRSFLSSFREFEAA